LKILKGSSPIEVYKTSFQNEVGWPAFVTEKGNSQAKHEGGCELVSVAKTNKCFAKVCCPSRVQQAGQLSGLKINRSLWTKNRLFGTVI
jgi:hypothetical protein